ETPRVRPRCSLSPPPTSSPISPCNGSSTSGPPPLPPPPLPPRLSFPAALPEASFASSAPPLPPPVTMISCRSSASSLTSFPPATSTISTRTTSILALILTSDFVEESNKKIAVSDLYADLDRSVSALIRVLRDGNGLESRIDAAIVLDAIIAASDAGTMVLIAEEELIRELVRLIGPSDEKGAAMDRRAVEAGLGCLARISAAKRARPRVVRSGVVPALARVLMASSAVAPAATAEKALRVMEAAAGCAEDGAAAATAVVARMVKAGREGAESAVAVLWSVCQAFRDRRAVEAVAAAEGGATKMLLLMQSGCSPAARQMAADLLKIYRVNSKSCLAGYDTKTTHITPF
ncbi:U-box domain-containing protein, partial [Musa troglodytarum]